MGADKVKKRTISLININKKSINNEEINKTNVNKDAQEQQEVQEGKHPPRSFFK